jgi:hypothetical protein
MFKNLFNVIFVISGVIASYSVDMVKNLHLASRNNFRVTKKFLIAKFDCTFQKEKSAQNYDHNGLSTLKKYHGDSMGLHEFFHHSAIISCINFHA